MWTDIVFMKQFIFTIFLAGCLTGISQAQQVDPRLQEALGANQTAGLSSDSIKFYTYIVQNGYVVMEMPDHKRTQLPLIDQLQMKNGTYSFTSEADLANFNRLLVVEPTNERLSQSFQIPNSSKVLILPSMLQLKLMAKDEQ